MKPETDAIIKERQGDPIVEFLVRALPDTAYESEQVVEALIVRRDYELRNA